MAKDTSAPALGQPRYEILVPSADSIVPSRARAPSAGKVAEASQDLERFLFSLQQRRGVGPFGARRTLRVKPKRRRVEKDALALDLLDHRPFRQHFLQRLAAREAATVEFQPAQLGQRMVLVLQGRLDPILGAEVAQEDRDDQRIRLVAGHLHKTGCAGVGHILDLEMPEVLHLEQASGEGARDPGWLATPRAGDGEGFELGMHALETLLG